MSECVLTDCENGILHEYDCNDSFGHHTTGVIYCPMCHPEQYEPDSDPLIAAAPEMLQLIERAGEIMIELESLADSSFASDAFVQKSQWHKDVAALQQKIGGMDDCTDCDDKLFAAQIDALLATMEGTK